jgi:hypothetical protein
MLEAGGHAEKGEDVGSVSAAKTGTDVNYTSLFWRALATASDFEWTCSLS